MRLVESILKRPLFAALGLAAACVLVWFLGPLFALAAAHPLASEGARWSTIGVLIALALGLTMLRAARSARRNRRLIEGLGAGVGPAAAARGAHDLAQIGQRFEEAIAALKATHLGGKGALLGALFGRPFVYQLPWYVIIGAPGAGKTTALVNSGLEFPLAARLGKQPVRGIGGTRNCDWWFASDAVLIDTAGRFTTQDSDREADRLAWSGFLDLLVRYRPRRPINGVLLTLSVTDLLAAAPEERQVHTRKLRERVDELHGRLGAGIPIYVLVTKMDLLAGFMEFFADFDKDERAQVWGVTFPHTPETPDVDPLARLGAELVALEKRLDECLIERLQGEHDRERRAAIYTFPQQWRVLRETLVGFLQGAFPASRPSRPLVRGVYFTSATQEGTPMDRALGELARTLGLTNRMVVPARPSGKSFFVTRLLRDVVFAEAGLAGANLRLQRGRALLHWSAIGVTCVAVAGALVLAWRAYEAERARVFAVATKLPALAREVAAARDTKADDLAALVPTLDALEALGRAAPGSAPGRPGQRALAMGLDQSVVLIAGAQDAYRHVLREVFQPRIAARLEERLRAGRPDNVTLIYEALKAYLMLFGGRNFDAASLRGYLYADWDATLVPAVGAGTREALRRHLDELLAGGEVGAPARADRELIEKTRGLVASVPLAQRVYDRLRSLDFGPALPAFTIAAAAGPGAAQVFARASGLPLTLGVPGLYTRAFLTQHLRERSQDVLGQFAAEGSWVLGTKAQATPETLRGPLQQEVEHLYLADYARLWDEYLRDLRLAPSDGLARSAQIAQTLARADSPLVALLASVEREVSALAPAPAGGVTRPAASRAVADRNAGKQGDEADAADAAARFEGLSRFVAGQPPSLQEAVALLGKLGAHLAAVDDALRRKVAPPASDVTREFVQLARQAPEPARGLLLPFASRSAGEVFAARRDEIARLLVAEVTAPCKSALEGRFPIARTAREDVAREDFVRWFAAGGLLDGFFQRQLAPYVDTAGATWAYYKPDGSTEGAESLQAFQRAQTVRAALFSDGGRTLGTRLEFRLLGMDPGVGSLALDVDGQGLRFTRDSRQPQSVRWPAAGTSADGHVALRLFTNTPGSGEPYGFDGVWALLRLFNHVRVEPGPSPDRVQLEFDVEGRKARFEAKSAGPVNPLRLAALGEFQCPQRL